MGIRQVRLLSSILTIGLGLFAATAPVRGTDGGAELSAEDIVAASVDASGGKALDAVRSVRREADMRLESDMFGVLDGQWEIAFLPGRSGFQQSRLGNDSTTIAWDGNTCWEDGPMGLRELNAEETALNRWLWELSFLHALVRDSRAGTLKRLSDESIEGTLHHVLEFTEEDGSQTRIFVDSETSLISRLSSSIFIQMLGRSTATTDYADYSEIDGIMLPQFSRQKIENLWVVEARFTETEIDPELPEGLFERPDEL